MNKTTISWTDCTWNVLHGCTKVSEECDHCYSCEQSYKMEHTWDDGPYSGMGITKMVGDEVRWMNLVRFDHFNPKTGKNWLDDPIYEPRPYMVFGNSMSDIFHKDVKRSWIEAIFDVCRRAPQHQFQFLTKRPERMLEMDADLDYPENVWMGVSVGMDKNVGYIDYLRQCSGMAVKFASLEPLLESLPSLSLEGVDQAIVGGESGKGFRPMEISWVEQIRQKALDAGCAYYFKQDASFRSGVKARFLDRPDLFLQEFPEARSESLRTFYALTEGRAKIMRK